MPPVRVMSWLWAMYAGRMRSFVRFLFAAVLLVLAACQLPVAPPWRQVPSAALYTIATPFNEREFAGYDRRGSSSISGEAYFRTGGSVVLAAGSEVVLVPDTAYTRELWEPARSGRYRGVANFDPRYFKYRRSTVADSNGYFRFTGLPAGSYIVQTHVPAIDEGKAVFLHRRVTIEDNSAANIILSGLNQQ